MASVDKSGWVSVRCVFRTMRPEGQSFEERITLWRTPDMDTAIERAETEANAYAAREDVEYLGFAQSYLLYDQPADGAEIFSLIRDSSLDPAAYLDAHFDTGGERQQGGE
jgi:hypothetical protein